MKKNHFTTQIRSDLRPIDILTEEIAIEVTGVVGVGPALWYFRYIASIFLTLYKRLWSVDNFFLKCNIYTEHTIQLFHGMSNLGFDISIENILF